MPTPLTIWCNADLSPEGLAELRAGTASHHLVFAGEATGNLYSGGPSESLAMAEVAFGQPDPGQAASLPGLRWVHLTSAGYTRYDTPLFRDGLASRGAVLTNSSTVFADPCAQHLLAFMLAAARQLPASLADQLGGRTWVYDALRPVTRVLRGETVLIVGYGAIGRRLAELLAPFEMNVIGVRRKVVGDEPIPMRPLSELDQLLPQAEHVVNILPANDSTGGFFGASRFAAMKLGALFYNVGRGSTVDQGALAASLESGQLGLAYLDVTDPEPLPGDHPLWGAPNCYITPHIAGGHDHELLMLVKHFLANLRRYEVGERLADRIV